ncbi:MAG: DUF3990 domain-containing protein [Lachnospiraceae bacterium]|nr:DUF3990 domain-containing protein [Lachnospiraceae bacterium]
MILYHTSTIEIRDPDIYRGRKNADFGQGFYMTSDYEFTHRWAGRDAIVNKYELNETGLNIQHLERNIEWFEYIFNNRHLKDEIKADVITGPIANDTIFDTMGILSSGFIKHEIAMQLLMIGPEYTQVVIKTEKAKANLKWIGSEKKTELDEAVLKAEKDAFAAEFAALFQKLV